MRSLIAACWAARRTTCVEPPNIYEQTLDAITGARETNPYERRNPSIGGIIPNMEPYKGCEQSQSFVAAFVREAEARSVPDAAKITNGDACTDFNSMAIPDANSALILGVMRGDREPLILPGAFAPGGSRLEHP